MKPTNPKQLRSLVQLLSHAKGEKELEALLEDLLTPQEIATLAERIEIFRFLKLGMAQREIAEKLGCGIATVTRGSREMNHGHAIVPKLLERI